jgi:hypothetical protein
MRWYYQLLPISRLATTAYTNSSERMAQIPRINPFGRASGHRRHECPSLHRERPGCTISSIRRLFKFVNQKSDYPCVQVHDGQVKIENYLFKLTNDELALIRLMGLYNGPQWISLWASVEMYVPASTSISSRLLGDC